MKTIERRLLPTKISALLIKVNLTLAVLIVLLIIFSSINVAGVESNVVYTILRILQDNDLFYTDSTALPFAINQYNPLYFMVNDALLSLFPFDPGSFFVRVVSRLVSTVAFGICLFYSLKIIEKFLSKKLPNDSKLLIIGILTLFLLPYPFISRPDAFVSLFLIVAAYHFLQYLDTQKLIDIGLAGLFSTLCFASKQNGLLLFLALSFCLLFWGRLKALLVYVSTFGLTLMLFGWLYYLLGYNLEFILENIIGGVNNGINIRAAIYNAILPFWLVFGLPMMVLIVGIGRHKEQILKNKKLQLLLFLFLINSLAALGLSLKMGSGINYFQDTILLGTILIFSLRDNQTKKNFLPALLFCSYLAIFQTIQYGPRLGSFLINKEYRQGISMANAYLENHLPSSSYFASNIRELILDKHNQVVFPQLEIFLISNKNAPTSGVQHNVGNIIEKDTSIQMMVVDHRSPMLPFSKEHFKKIKLTPHIDVYERKID